MNRIERLDLRAKHASITGKAREKAEQTIIHEDFENAIAAASMVSGQEIRDFFDAAEARYAHQDNFDLIETMRKIP